MRYCLIFTVILFLGCNNHNDLLHKKQMQMFEKIKSDYQNDVDLLMSQMQCHIMNHGLRGDGELYSKLIESYTKCTKTFRKFDILLEKRELTIIDVKKAYDDPSIYSFINKYIGGPKKYGFTADSINIVDGVERDIETIQSEIEYLKLEKLVCMEAHGILEGGFVYPYPITFVKNEDKRALIFFGIFDTVPGNYPTAVPKSEQVGKVIINKVFYNGHETSVPINIDNKNIYQEVKFEATKKGFYNWDGFYLTRSGPSGSDTFDIQGKFEVK
jgi:hypothetical protein